MSIKLLLSLNHMSGMTLAAFLTVVEAVCWRTPRKHCHRLLPCLTLLWKPEPFSNHRWHVSKEKQKQLFLLIKGTEPAGAKLS